MGYPAGDPGEEGAEPSDKPRDSNPRKSALSDKVLDAKGGMKMPKLPSKPGLAPKAKPGGGGAFMGPTQPIGGGEPLLPHPGAMPASPGMAMAPGAVGGNMGPPSLPGMPAMNKHKYSGGPVDENY